MGNNTPPEPTSRMHAVNELLWRMRLLLMLLITAASACGLMMTDMPHNAPYLWAWRWLSAPLLLGGWLYAWSQRRYFLKHRQVPLRRFLLSAICFPPVLLLLSGGMVSLLNASSKGEVVRFEGPVTRLKISYGKSNTYLVTLRDEKTQQEVTLYTNFSIYRDLSKRLHEGKFPRFQRDMNIGLLGIPFRWR